jgi:hypothetical protein
MGEPKKKPVWPWIVGSVAVCLIAFVLGAVCFFAVLWIGNENFRQFIGGSQNANSRQ